LRASHRTLASAVVVVAALGLATGACSTSVLIKPDDQAFTRAQHRLEKTTTLVEALAPPPAESALFMQAEAFRQYRFTPPPRRALSYLGEVAAAVTEFPVLQSLAGSLDLLDLRLRSNDAAIQLWETLLANRPTTVLRPLTLYRLGWAYRTSGVSGLPRGSGDEAWGALTRESPGTRLAALSLEAKSVPWKSKDAAAGWSVVPGLGQFYVGEKWNGAVRLAVALAAMAAIAVPVWVAYDRRSDLSWSRDWPLLATSVGGLVVLSIDYTTSYEDAMRGVVEWNERAEAAFDDAHPDAP
jgi:hypothetical protein